MGGVAKTLLSRSAAFAARKDGKIALLSTTRQRKSGGAALRGWGAQLEVARDMVFDIDAKRIVEYVSDGMADYFGERMLAGLRPDAGTLPEVSSETQQISKRADSSMGVRSGWMAENWDVGKINGTSFRADRVLKPNGGSGQTTRGSIGLAPGGRAFVIQNLLRRKHEPVDFQSVKGSAAKRLQELLVEALGEGMPSRVLERGAGQRKFTSKRRRKR